MSRDNIVNKAGSSSGDPPSLQANPKEKREFQSGDKVRIIGKTSGHSYQIGDIVYLVSEKPYASGQWGTNEHSCNGEEKSGGYVQPYEIELVTEEPQKIPDGYTWNIVATHTYQDYISVGWTDKQLIENGLLVPIGVSGKPKHTAYVKFPDYHKTYAYILPDSIYEKIRGYKDVKLWVQNRDSVSGRDLKVVNLVDLKVNYVDPVATKEIAGVESVRLEGEVSYKDIEITLSSHKHQGIIPIGQTGMKSAPLEEIYNEWKSKQTNQFLNNKEETNMSQVNRKVLNFKLIDSDSALPVDQALVHDFGDIVVEDDIETVKQQLLGENDLKAILEKHNKKRVLNVNLTIQQNTGNTVKLLPITKVKELTWSVK